MARPCSHCGRELAGIELAFGHACAQSLDAPEQASPSEIIGLDGLTNEQILLELQHGGKFVTYQYCVSLLFVTRYRATPVHFIRSQESAVVRGMKYTLLSLLAGWWGIPFGPPCTIAAVAINLSGGRTIAPTIGSLNALRNA